jgi:hypothetical protein
MQTAQPVRPISCFDWWISKDYFAQSLIQEFLYKLPFMEYLYAINSCNLIHGIEPYWVRNEALRYSCCSDICESRIGWSCSSRGKGGWCRKYRDRSADLAEVWWLALRQIVGRYICCKNAKWNEVPRDSSQWRTVAGDIGPWVLLESGCYLRYCTSSWRPCAFTLIQALRVASFTLCYSTLYWQGTNEALYMNFWTVKHM